MRVFTQRALACFICFMGFHQLIAQPVDLGTASSFAVFTAAGAFSNDGNTVVTGDIGTNVGAFTGFPPGIVIGEIHVADVISAQAATDVALAYGMLFAMTCGEVLGTTMGGGQILTPNIYCLGAASVIDGDLILDGECDPDAVFIFQINGALSTTTLSTVTLINSASLCNIYWQVNGAVSLGPESVFRGNIVAGGAISLLEGADLEGRALTTAGAIDMHNNTVDINMLPTASILIAEGAIEFCEGESVILSGNCGGTWNTGESTATITVSESGDYFVTTENDCGIAISNHIIVEVNPLPLCDISGDLAICEGESTELCAGVGFASYLWSTGETTACITVAVEGLYTVTVTDALGCTSSCNVTIAISTPPICTITGTLALCEGESTELCAGAGFASYLWSTGETTACITVATEGLYTVTVTDALGCTSSCNVTIAISTPPICTITGTLALCEGESTELCAGAGFASYLWSTGETTACITVATEGQYTITVTDALGCTSSCNVTVVISTPPSCAISGELFICGGESVELCAGTGFASYLWSTGESTACITVDMAGIYTVTVTDASGCSSSCEVTVIVTLGNEPPLITCPLNVVIECDEVTLPSNTGFATATDNCNNSLAVDFTDEIIDGSCLQAYTITRTWIATDDNGNTATCTQTISIEDTTAPIILCVAVVSPIACGSLPSFGSPSVTDACDGSVVVTFLDITVSGLCPQAYSVIRTWIATDDCGNSAQCSATVVVEDNTSPIITCPVVVSPIQCGSTPAFGLATAIDGCDGSVEISFSDETIPGECGQGYSVTRTWVALDDCGNSAQCSRTIVVEGSAALEITCPIEISPIECGSLPVFGMPVITESCNGLVDVTFSDLTIQGPCPQEYSVTRTWLATDACGNTAECNATIVVQDNTSPVITCPTVVSPIECGTTPTFGTPVVSDACDGSVDVIFSDISIQGPCPQEYSITRTWIATDDCGNTADCSATIVVQDNTPPLITCPTVVSPIECGTTPTFVTPVVTDACDGLIDVIFSDITIQGQCAQEYSITRTWIATDDCGNSSQCSATIVVQDNTAPIITCAVVVSPIECGTTPSFGTPVVTDACDGSVTATFSDITIPGQCPQEYSVTRTWLAIDDCGNSAQCSATIVVQDNSAPIITCAVVVSPIECGTTPSFGTPVVTDACDGSVTATFSDITIPGQCPQEYSVTRTWLAIDDCGNSAQCSATIVVQDNTAPIITCAVVVSPIECGTTPSFGTPVVTDACDGSVTATFSDITIPGQCPQEYSVTRTWLAIDDCGNSAQCSATIVVQDNTAPIITCAVVVSPIECGTTPSFGTPVVTDACDGSVTATFSDITIPGQCPQEYSVTRTWLAIDDCGNSAQCSATIVVQDNTAPLITCPTVVSPIECGTPPSFGSPTVLDACDGSVTVTFSDITIPGQCPQAYSVTRTWIAIDDCGNSSQCSATIVIEDIQPPSIILPEGIAEGDTIPVQCYGQDPQWDLPVYDENSVDAIDVCDDNVTVTFQQTLEGPGDCEEDGYINLYRLVWTAVDDCGNMDSAVVYLALVDTIAPVIFGIPADVSIDCNSIPEPPVLIYALDECLCACVVYFEETIITQPSGCQDNISVIRTWTATDRCGNQTVEQQAITLIDTSGPELQIIQSEIENVANGTILEYTCNAGGIPAFFDTMGIGSIISVASCGGIGTLAFANNVTVTRNCEFFGYVEQRVYEWVAVDQCGNQSIFSLTIRLIDDEAPVFVDLPAMTCTGDPALDEVEVVDNCGSASFRYWDVAIENPCGTGNAIRRTYEAFDDCGNITRDTVMIIPNDLTLPIMGFVTQILNDLPGGDVLTISCNAQNGQYTAFGIHDVSMIDPCAAGVTITYAEHLLSTGDCTNGGSLANLELVWTATDVCGNHSEQSVLAAIIDTAGPVFIGFQSSMTIGCGAAMPVSVASDNCGDIHISTIDSIIPGNCAYEYDVIRQITASDPCGNSTTRIQTIHVGNGSGPTITGVIPYVCEDLTIPIVTAFDDCAQEFVPVSMVQDTIADTCFAELVIRRTWTARDACGHTAQIQQHIIMDDSIPPVILIPSHSVIHQFIDHSDNLIYFSQVKLITLLDALHEHSVYVEAECLEILFAVDTLYAADCKVDGYAERRTYTWMVVDVCGNVDSVYFIVDIMDDVPPIMNDTLTDTTYICVPLPMVPDMVADNPVQQVSVVFTEVISPGDAPGVFNVTRTWTATDSCQNSSVVVHHIIWIPESTIECNIIIPESVECNSHGVIIGSDVTGGFGPYEYVWQVVGEKCFIQAGQNTPEIQIYVGWAPVKIILTITDSAGCVSMCMITLECTDPFEAWTIDSADGNVDQGQRGDSIFQTILTQEQGEQLAQVAIWPNPVNEMLNLGFEIAIEQEMQVSLINMFGQVLLRDQFVSTKGKNIHPIDVSELPNASYMMELRTTTAVYTKMIVVLRDQ